jgi:hypothetical protein
MDGFLPSFQQMTGLYPGFEVDPESLRAYATRLEAFKDRFAALQVASDSIEYDVGALAPFFAPSLEPLLDMKHAAAAELIPEGADTLDTHIAALNQSAETYEGADAAAGSELDTIEGEL